MWNYGAGNVVVTRQLRTSKTATILGQCTGITNNIIPHHPGKEFGIMNFWPWKMDGSWIEECSYGPLSDN